MAAEYIECISAEGPGYDTKHSDGEHSVMLQFKECWVALLFLSLPGSIWPGVIAPDSVLSIGQIELFHF